VEDSDRTGDHFRTGEISRGGGITEGGEKKIRIALDKKRSPKKIQKRGRKLFPLGTRTFRGRGKVFRKKQKRSVAERSSVHIILGGIRRSGLRRRNREGGGVEVLLRRSNRAGEEKETIKVKVGRQKQTITS